MVNDEKQLMICKIETKGKLNKKKVLIVILIILCFVLIFMSGKNIFNTIREYKVYKQYEKQLNVLKQQDEERKNKQEEERQKKMPKLTQIGKDNINNIYHSENKRAFLTFDDGPSNVTPRLLDTLKKENIKATFFVLGSRVQVMPNMVKRMYDEGHYIGNHGYSHTYSQIYSSKEAVLDEYNKCNEQVQKAIGVPEYNSHLFRFPGGYFGGPYAEVKKQAKELLLQNDIECVDWNALSGDSETNNLSIELELSRLKETIENKNSVVILMHDAPIKEVTADALPEIIAVLKEQGYEFENFYEIIK